MLLHISGENSIVIVAGANLLITEQDILNAETMIASSKVLICQFEISKTITLFALELAHKLGGIYAVFYMSVMVDVTDN